MDTSSNKKIIDGVIMLPEFDETNLGTPPENQVYLYAEDDGTGNTVVKTKDSAGTEVELGQRFGQHLKLNGSYGMRSASNDMMELGTLTLTEGKWMVDGYLYMSHPHPSGTTSYFFMNVMEKTANLEDHWSNYENNQYLENEWAPTLSSQNITWPFSTFLYNVGPSGMILSVGFNNGNLDTNVGVTLNAIRIA